MFHTSTFTLVLTPSHRSGPLPVPLSYGSHVVSYTTPFIVVVHGVSVFTPQIKSSIDPSLFLSLLSSDGPLSLLRRVNPSTHLQLVRFPCARSWVPSPLVPRSLWKPPTSTSHLLPTTFSTPVSDLFRRSRILRYLPKPQGT